MKRIRESDINFIVNPKLINLSNFNIKFYTVNRDVYIEKSQDDLRSGSTENEYVLKLDWLYLKQLGEGILQFNCINNYEDSGFIDLEFNESVHITTEYFIDSSKEINYDELIADLDLRLNEEIDRATNEYREIYATINSVNSGLTTAIEAEENRAETRETALNDALETVSGNLETYIIDNNLALQNEIARATSAETQLNETKLDISTYQQDELVISAALNDLQTNKADKTALSEVSNHLADLETSLENGISCGDYA